MSTNELVFHFLLLAYSFFFLLQIIANISYSSPPAPLVDSPLHFPLALTIAKISNLNIKYHLLQPRNEICIPCYERIHFPARVNPVTVSRDSLTI